MAVPPYLPASALGAATGAATLDSAGLVPLAQLGRALTLNPAGVKTSAYTAAASDLVPVDTTGGNITITLPVAPPNLTTVGVKHVIQGGTNTVTIACGGSAVFNAAGGSTTRTLTLASQAILLQYASAPGIWYVLADDLPLAGLDGRYATTAAAALLAPLAGTNTFPADQYFKSGRPWFDVVAFGADPTGTADSTAAIQAAISAAIGLRTDTSVGFTATSTTVTNPAAVSGDVNLYLTSQNFPRLDTGCATFTTTTVTDASAQAADLGCAITGTGIPAATTITAVNNGVGYTISNAATATASGLTFTVIGGSGGYAQITAVTAGVGYTVSLAATATLSAQTATVGTAAKLSARTAKGPVYLPAGTYKTTADLLIRSVVGFRFMGAGADQTRIAPSGTGFAQSVLSIDGSLDGAYESFVIQGNGTEQVTSCIRLDWTTAASRSTSANLFRSIRIRNTKWVTGISLEGNGSRQVDGTVLQDIVINGGQTAGAWSTSGNWQTGLACGCGVQGNNYDHVAYGVGVAACQYGYAVNCSSLAVFGAQPGANGVDFQWVTPTAQCTVENIQSQNSGQLVVCTSGSSPVPIAFRDIAFKGWTGTGYNPTWISTGTQGGNWTLENVSFIQLSPPTPPTISVAGGHGGFYGSVFVAINVSQPCPPATGFTIGTGQPIVAIGYQDVSAGVGNNAVLHPLYCINANWGYSTGTAAARPAATLNGEGWYWATDTSALSRSNGTAWTSLLSQNAVVTAPDVQWFTASGTWTKPTAPLPITTEVYLMGGGGGGGSGRQGPSGTVATGGGGGGGAGVLYRKFITTDLGATVAVTVGAGGGGGAAITTTATNGNAGSAGTATSFGTVAYNNGGFAGGGGLSAAASGGGAAGVGTSNGSAGGGNLIGGTAGTNSSAAAGASGGGGGGGLTAAPAASAGGSAALSQEGYSSNVGVIGVVDSTLPTAGTLPTVKATPSCGGAGGCSSITTAAQTGATAFFGGGGGGGGASLNGNNSGAGGTGGPGFALVISYYQ